MATMKWGDRSIDFNGRTLVMGILNCTPDSFYPGSRKTGTDAAIAEAGCMVESGVDIIDIGGESSRPGSDPVSAEVEMERICPVIEGIRRISDVLISVDTTKAEVAEKALNLGADMINDISGLRADDRMKHLAAQKRVPVILMHMRGTPKNMQDNPWYDNVVREIKQELNESVQFALDTGLDRNLIIVDPGIGFGKRVEDNLAIIRNLAEFKSFDLPILIGISRKSFLGHILDLPVEERMIASITANIIAMINGADILRVHDYRETMQMVRVVNSIMGEELNIWIG